MKFLLKQKIKRTTLGDTIKLYPGNPGLIKLAKQLEIKYNEVKKQEGSYWITMNYFFNINEYFTLLSKYKEKINQRRQQFKSQDPLIQLIKILRYIFNRNNKAKENSIYSAIQNAYDDKEQFLEIALEIARDINYPFFKYGYDEDPWNEYHHYLYYFEIENVGQVSFHSAKLFQNIPKFPGKWIGVVNETFPFNLREIKKSIKSEV